MVLPSVFWAGACQPRVTLVVVVAGGVVVEPLPPVVLVPVLPVVPPLVVPPVVPVLPVVPPLVVPPVVPVLPVVLPLVVPPVVAVLPDVLPLLAPSLPLAAVVDDAGPVSATAALGVPEEADPSVPPQPASAIAKLLTHSAATIRPDPNPRLALLI
jgi:hypothetical protein